MKIIYSKLKTKTTARLFTTTVFLLMIIPILLVSFFTKSRGMFPILLIPIYYIVVYILLLDLTCFMRTPGLLVVNGLYLLRYYVMPLLSLLHSDTNYTVNYSDGIWFLLYEQIVVSFFLVAYINRYATLKKKLELREKSADFLFKKNSLGVFFGGLLLLSGLIFLNNNKAFSKYHFIFGVSSSSLDEYGSMSSSLSTLEEIVISMMLMIVPCVIAVCFARKYFITCKRVYYFLAFVCSIFFSVCIIQGTDRGTVILKGVAILFFINRLFPHKYKGTMIYVGGGIATVAVYLVLVRALESAGGGSEKSIISHLTEYVDLYVAGIKNMSATLEMHEIYGEQYDFSTVFNDLFMNVPIVSRFADVNNSSNYFFNCAMGRGFAMDQVMPLVGNGLFWLGRVLAPLLTGVSLYFVFFFDSKYATTEHPFYAYVLSYIAGIMGFIHYQNIQLIMLYFSCNILPLWLISVCSKFVDKKLIGGKK